jgi:Mn2+/Fe2+ NRAMP family transporter
VLALAQVRLSYVRLAAVLRWLCLSLLAYVGALLFVHIDWHQALAALLWPRLDPGMDVWLVIVAVLGTTISPYLFFWQAGQEVEEMRRKGDVPLLVAPEPGVRELLRIRFDTTSGMLFSNLIALAIMLAAASTLHANGITNIEIAAQAAAALRPLAGAYATLLFAAGIIGTGLLAVPVLAGSAAYAVADAMGWRSGPDHRLSEARGFYLILIGATVAGTALDFTPLDPVKALFYSAVLNGIVAVPLMAMLMLLASNRAALREFVLSPTLAAFGWLATLLMLLAVAAWFWSTIRF